MSDNIVIIGSGLAGYNVARELRKLDTTTPLVMLTADQGEFYSKPMLSNGIAKNKTAAELVNATAEKMAADLNMEIMTRTRVTAINLEEKTLTTQSGNTIAYDKLVLAMGASSFVPPFKGDALDELTCVNSLDDYALYRDKIQAAKSIVIIGAGLIGCEFANDLCHADAQNDFKVSVVDAFATPLNNLIPEQAGLFFKEKLVATGIDFRLGQQVASINKSGQHYSVCLGDGSTLQADLVLVATGLRANIKLAKQAGIAVNKGIVVDPFLKTSVNDVYALGDCAEIVNMLLPYVMPLMNSARALARTLAGEPTRISFPAMPVVVKTPACPVVSNPPAENTQGQWQIESGETGLTAKYYNDQNELCGFVLLGDNVSEKQALTKQVPAVLA